MITRYNFFSAVIESQLRGKAIKSFSEITSGEESPYAESWGAITNILAAS